MNFYLNKFYYLTEKMISLKSRFKILKNLILLNDSNKLIFFFFIFSHSQDEIYLTRIKH